MSQAKPKRDLDERHSLPADDPEEALRALLKVDPESEPVENETEEHDRGESNPPPPA